MVRGVRSALSVLRDYYAGPLGAASLRLRQLRRVLARWEPSLIFGLRASIPQGRWHTWHVGGAAERLAAF